MIHPNEHAVAGIVSAIEQPAFWLVALLLVILVYAAGDGRREP